MCMAECFPRLLLETRGSDEERKEKKKERERETTGLKCILILRVDLHNCFDYAVFFPDGIAVDSGDEPPILDFVA